MFDPYDLGAGLVGGGGGGPGLGGGGCRGLIGSKGFRVGPKWS